MKQITRKFVGRAGQNMVEYVLLLSLILPLAIVGIRHFGATIANTTEPLLAAGGTSDAASGTAPRDASSGSPAAASDEPATRAGSNVYYVDAAGGSDSNPGTSEGAPWKSVAKVNATGLAPGDSVLFKKGCVWRETLVLGSSGAEDAPITIGAYGEGSKPILKGSRASDEDGCEWVQSAGGTNEYYLVKSGGNPGYRKPGNDLDERPGWLWYKEGPTRLLKGIVGSLADGQWGWGDLDGLGFSTFYVRCDAGMPGPIEIPQATEGVLRIVGKSHIVVRDLSVQFADLMPAAFTSDGAHHITFEDCEFAYNLQTGLQIWGCQNAHHDAYVTVSRCVAHDNGGHGISADGQDRKPVCKLRQVTIEDCEAYGQVRSYFGDVDGYGIMFTFVDDSTIRRCKSHDNELTGIHMDGNTGAPLEYLDGCQNNEIHNNTTYGNGGAGIEAEVSSNNRIHDNEVYDNGSGWAGSGICINNHANGNKLHHNLIRGNIGGPAINIYGSSTGTEVVNNTVRVGTTALHIEDAGSTAGTQVFNNILHSQSLCFTFAAVEGLTSDYNCVGSGGKRFGEPWPTYNLAGWQQLSGQDTHSIDATEVFVDPDHSDFDLRPDSPCIDTGTEAGFPHEGNAPDMGAREYSAQAPPVSQWTLDVQSTPITSVSISSSPSGTTNYSAELDEGASVSLTAPAAHSAGDTDYEFVRWTLNGADQAAGETSLSFTITADTTAVAVYEIEQRTLNVQSTPVTGVTVTASPPHLTNYSTTVDDNSALSVTASATHSDSGTDYQFVRWTLNGADQPAGETTVGFDINEDVTVVAQYREASGLLQVIITYPTSEDGILSQSMVTVQGTADDGSDIEAIWVNGVLASKGGADYSTWHATIPLTQGWAEDDPDAVNTIVASALDTDGNYYPSADTETVKSVGECGRYIQGGLSLRYKGNLATGDVDTFQFEAVEGTLLDVQLKAKVKTGLTFGLELYDPRGEQFSIPSPYVVDKGSSLSVKKCPLPLTGLYTLRVLASSGSGAYELSVRGKLPKTRGNVEAELDGGESSRSYRIAAMRGSSLTLAVYSNAFEPDVEVLDPLGSPLSLEACKVVKLGRVQLKTLPLPDTGEPYETGVYTVVVTSGNGTAGAYRLAWWVTAPKAVQQRCTAAVLRGVSPKGGVGAGEEVQLKVEGPDPVAGGNAVVLSGRQVAAHTAEVKNGKGTLCVNVPNDLAAGTHDIYFICNGEKSNQLTFDVLP